VCHLRTRRTRGTYGGRGSVYQLPNCLGRNESAAPNRDVASCLVRRSWSIVFREMPPKSLRASWIEYSARSCMGPSWRSRGARPSHYWPLTAVLTVDSPRRKHCGRLPEKESRVFEEFAQILQKVSRLIGSKYCRNSTNSVSVRRSVPHCCGGSAVV
jgi:hypothetical protein